MSKQLLYLIVLVLAVTGTASGDQWDITVPDAGFDDHLLRNPGDWISISDNRYDGAWKSHGVDTAWVDYLYWANNGYPEDLVARSGNNKMYPESDYVYQILDETFIEGGTYTLSVWVGEPWGGGGAWFLYFTGEDYTNNLIEASGIPPLDWTQVSVSYTATAADAEKKFGIKIWGGYDVACDDVTLSYDGPPRRVASGPTPADGAEVVNDWAFLSWIPGAGALEHDVYFGTSFDDVNDATASEPPVDPYKGRQTDTIYEVSALVPGTTYYWRIDEVNDTDPCSPYKGVVWSFWLSPWEPTNPNPPDGALYMDPNIDLSWSAGFAATMHEVFFGTDPCALVAFPKFSGDPNYDPGTLLKDTTYYWQVKEYQPQGRRTLGPIWSFSTTLSTMGTCLYEYWDGITPDGTSLSLLYNWPDFPGNPTGTQELTLFEGPTNRAEQFGARIQAWLYAPVTGDYKFWIATDDNGELYLSTDDDPANKQLISWVSTWAAPRNWADPDITPSGLIALVAGQKYYIEGLMKEGGGGDNIAVGWTTPFDDTIQVITGNYLERYVQMPAWNPRPADGAMGVPRPIMLRWLPGAYAAQHQVYFGTSEASMTLQDTLPFGTEEYDPPGTLDVGQIYYWKVNEVNVAGPDPFMWEGDTWSFTVAEYIVVDDMEDYNDRMAIITVWRDGYTGGPVGNSGANVTVSTESDGRDPRLDGDGPPWPVRDSEAMQVAYDNDGSITIYIPGYLPYSYSVDANYYSEAKAGIANLPIGATNWAEGDVKALSLWFYGDADNDIEPMWVKLTDQVGGSGKVTYGDYGEDPNDLKEPSWHEWNIALSDFGVDLTQVKDISIGFGDENNHTTPGGSGVVFFDDIRLYTPRCILSLRSADFARADFVEDCVVDDKEFEIIVENWLAAEPIMLPITIDNPGFEAEPRGDGTYNYAHQGWGWFANAEELGTWNPGLVGEIGYGGDAPEGQNVGWTNPGGVGVPGGFAQVLTETLNADTTYKLTVEVGNVAGYPWGGYSVQLLAGGTPGDTGEITVGNLLAEDANSLTIAVDTFETSSVTYTYNPALHSHLLGEPLQIRLLSLGNVVAGDYTEADFDDVKLFRSIKLYEDMIFNFKDYSLIASKFLEEDMFP